MLGASFLPNGRRLSYEASVEFYWVKGMGESLPKQGREAKL